MKFALKTLVLSSVLAATAAFAQETPEMAQSLYSKRGENIQNAVDAADMFGRIADISTGLDKMAFLKGEAQSLYYVGTHTKEDKEKKVIFSRAMEASTEAIAVVCKDDKCEESATFDDASKKALAEAFYQYGANLGKWAEANGVASSLGKWPELERTMKKIIALKQEDVQQYGAFRILGRAFYKLPAPMGSNKKAEANFKKAFDATLAAEDNISTHGLTNLYYVDLMIATDRKEEAKAILESFISKDSTTFNPARIPETKEEQVEAIEKLKELN